MHTVPKMHSLDRNFRAATYDENNRVCWGPLQTRKDTRWTLRPLSNRPYGIQGPELETLDFPISDISAFAKYNGKNYFTWLQNMET